MPFSKWFQRISVGLIGLFGVLILVWVAFWLHYWMHGLLNPNEIDLDDWLLGLSWITWLLQAAASIEALFIGVATRLRWISYQRGKFFVGFFSLIPIVYMLHGFWWAISNPYISFWLSLLNLIFMVPVVIAWLLLRSKKGGVKHRCNEVQ